MLRFQTLNRTDKVLMSRIGRPVLQLTGTKCDSTIAFSCTQGLDRDTVFMLSPWSKGCQDVSVVSDKTAQVDGRP